PPDASIPLVAGAADLLTPVPPGRASPYTYWRPFFGGSYRGPAYYDPPVLSVPDSGPVDGARVSSSPSPLSARPIGLRGAVAARASGTGSGTAATTKSGASSGSIDHGGAAAAKAGGFSAGRGGSAGGSSGS